MKWDVFISHASEDKESFVRELAHELKHSGLNVWYDEFSLSAGDSLRESIDRGISSSLVGIIVLSRAFFKKNWPRNELNGLFTVATNQNKALVPIWLGVTAIEVAEYSPMLADKVALMPERGMPGIVKEIRDQIAKYKLRRINKDVYIYTVDMGETVRDMVSLVPADWVFKHGYGLADEVILGILLTPISQGGDFVPDNFRDNLRFVRYLHQFLAQNAIGETAMLEAAQRQGNGYIYLIDNRVADPSGEVPPEDIIGVVQVIDGQVMPNSYQRNPNHQILTGDGFFMLPTPALEELLVSEMRRKCSDTHPGPPKIELQEKL